MTGGISGSGRAIAILVSNKIPLYSKSSRGPGPRLPQQGGNNCSGEHTFTVAPCRAAYASFRFSGTACDPSEMPKALRCCRMPDVCHYQCARQGRLLRGRRPHSADKFGQCSYPRPTPSREPAPVSKIPTRRLRIAYRFDRSQGTVNGEQ